MKKKIILLAGVLILCLTLFIYYSSKPLIKEHHIFLNSDEGMLEIDFIPNRFGNYYCSYDGGNSWQTATDNSCRFQLYDNYHEIILKNGLRQNLIGTNENIGYYQLQLLDDLIYLALNDHYQLKPELLTQGYFTTKLSLDYDPAMIAIDDNYQITALKTGQTQLTFSFLDQEVSCQLIISDLINKIPASFDYDKPYLNGQGFSQEDNDLLDTILQERINKAGYQTRAGVLAAARFLTLELAYRLSYFFENGRLQWGVDGQGRYYHQGLYLSDDRIDKLTYPRKNTGPWGSTLYSYSAQEKEKNGLDCSGFVTWVLLNAGFDIGDISALELCSIGENHYDIAKTIENDLIQAGDLVHNKELGSHIGLIIGMDSEYYYVAQSIWYGNSGVIITPYTKDEFISHWRSVVLMDSLYQKDGNYTAMWS